VPIDDPDLCGRIRDNLAIAGESANAKLASLSTREECGGPGRLDSHRGGIS